jgi:hypothetical protein
LIDEVEQLFAPPDHPVFQLVPPIFEQRIVHLYREIGSPVVTSDSFWVIYRHLLARFQAMNEDAELAAFLTTHEANTRTIEEGGIPLLPNQQELRPGANLVSSDGESYRYDGGATEPPLPNGWMLDNAVDAATGPEYADFTDSGGEG